MSSVIMKSVLIPNIFIYSVIMLSTGSLQSNSSYKRENFTASFGGEVYSESLCRVVPSLKS
jgi:hypothetical protein